MTTSPVTLRLATLEDMRFVWDVNNDPEARLQAINQSAIPWEVHERWYAEKLRSPNVRFYIASAGGARAAVVRFDIEGDEAIISIAVAPALRGKGIGTRAIDAATNDLIRRRPGTTLVAFVRPENVASFSAFSRAAYRRTGCAVRDGVKLERLERA